MGLRTSLYIPDQDTLDSIQTQAQQRRWSVSKYLIWLHDKYIENITSRGIIPPAVFVDSEESDQNPEKYPEGAVVTTVKDWRSGVNPRPKGQDGTAKKGK